MKNVSDSLADRVGIIRIVYMSMRELDGTSYRKHFLPTLERIEELEKESAEFDHDMIVSFVRKSSFQSLKAFYMIGQITIALTSKAISKKMLRML